MACRDASEVKNAIRREEKISPGIDGLIHISDMSWTKRVQHPSKVVKKGDAVDVVILNIDADNKRISLGLKQAQDDPWLKIG